MAETKTIFFYLFLILAFYIISPFIFIIILSFITAYALYPLLSFLRKYVQYKSVALILLISWVFIPLYFFSMLTYIEFQKLIPVFPLISHWVTDAFIYLADFGPSIIEKYSLDLFLQSGTLQLIESIRLFMIASLTKLAVGLPWFLFQFMLYIVSTYYILYDMDLFNKKINKYVDITPDEDNKCLIKTILVGLKNSFNFLIFNYVVLAIILGLLSYIIFLAAGLPFALLFSILIALITFIPNVGPWPFITLIGIGYYFTGINENASFIIIGYSLIGFIIFEYFIRPSFGAKAGKVSPLTTLFGIFGGTIVFGVKGILIGPIILILAETFIRTHYKLKEKKAEEKENKSALTEEKEN